MNDSQSEPNSDLDSAPTSPPASPRSSPDWIRLQKALSFEAEHGFNDIEGKQHRFSEFLSLALSQPPAELAKTDQHHWQELGTQFTTYSELTFAQRQHLVADTRRFLYQMRKVCEQKGGGEEEEARSQEPGTRNQEPGARERRLGKTSNSKLQTSFPSPAHSSSISLDQSLTYLPKVGPKSAEKLAKLGLYTVRGFALLLSP